MTGKNGHKPITHIGDLKPDRHNARAHNPRNIGLITTGLQEVGAGRSILIDADGGIIAGNGVVEAAALAGIERVRVVESDGNEIIAVRRSDLKGKRKTRMALLDNAPNAPNVNPEYYDAAVIAELAANERELLNGILDDRELAALLKDDRAGGADAEPQIDRAAELQKVWGTATGQLWRIGSHKLLCGDCTVRENVELVMGGEKAAICLTDPPYGIGLKYDNFNDTPENVAELAKKWLPIARDIAEVVVFSPGVTRQWLYPEPNWVICWFYGGGQLRSPWGFNCWQPWLCYGKDPSLAAGRGARPDAVDMNTPANAADTDHPCPKPLPLMAWLIERLSFGTGDTVLDMFCGGGSILVACENTRRKCRAIELSPAYVAVALQRMADAFPGIEIELTNGKTKRQRA